MECADGVLVESTSPVAVDLLLVLQEGAFQVAFRGCSLNVLISGMEPLKQGA